MSVLAQVDTNPLLDALRNAATFLPKFLAFLAILVIGYFVAKAIAKVLDRVLERVGFDRAVERGGVRKAMARSRYDASDIIGKLVFYALFLFVLQMAFGVFGPNPISDLIFAVIAFLPKVIVAIIIVVVAAALAAGARELVDASLGGLSYGTMLANLASGAILLVGIFAALNQIEIAPAIINGLFYAVLAVVAGSAIVAIGGGGIQPMRQQWERAMTRIEQEAPAIREEAANTSKEDLKARASQRRQQVSSSSDTGGSVRPGANPTIQLPDEPPTRRG
ncbi:MAG: hypothetical protein M3O86_06210 [Actinomycetota bacterium]|nr:hypothetical protein [Actinomycetota bacterium]